MTSWRETLRHLAYERGLPVRNTFLGHGRTVSVGEIDVKVSSHTLGTGPAGGWTEDRLLLVAASGEWDRQHRLHLDGAGLGADRAFTGLWQPTSWLDVNGKRGRTVVIYGEEGTVADFERLEALIAGVEEVAARFR